MNCCCVQDLLVDGIPLFLNAIPTMNHDSFLGRELARRTNMRAIDLDGIRELVNNGIIDGVLGFP